MDLHSGCISQQIAERFIVSGELKKYLTLIRREYRERRDIMTDALSRYAPAGLTWNRPEGGYYLWCRLPEGLSSDILVTRAAERGVAILPGTPSYLTPYKGECYIRLNYTFPPRDRIAEGIRILCEVIEELASARPEYTLCPDSEINPIL